MTSDLNDPWWNDFVVINLDAWRHEYSVGYPVKAIVAHNEYHPSLLVTQVGEMDVASLNHAMESNAASTAASRSTI